MAKIRDVIDSSLVDEVVNEIVSELKAQKGQRPVQTTLPQADLIRLRDQLQQLQRSFEVDEVEIERQVTEKFEDLGKDIDDRITRLEGQINELRTAMIRLSGEIRRIREGSGATS